LFCRIYGWIDVDFDHENLGLDGNGNGKVQYDSRNQKIGASSRQRTSNVYRLISGQKAFDPMEFFAYPAGLSSGPLRFYYRPAVGNSGSRRSMQLPGTARQPYFPRCTVITTRSPGLRPSTLPTTSSGVRIFFSPMETRISLDRIPSSSDTTKHSPSSPPLTLVGGGVTDPLQ